MSIPELAEVQERWNLCCRCPDVLGQPSSYVCGLKNKLDLLFPFATTSSFGYPFVLKLKDFVLLNNKHWLNDEVLNAFVQLINARCRRLDSSGSISSLPAAIVLNSFFYSKLAE